MNPKKYLIESIRNLSSKMSFEDITVQMILDDADVSRGTFYKYFRDKYDLANSYYSEFVKENIISKYDGSNWDSLLKEMLEFVKKNREFFQEMIKNGNTDFLSFISSFGLEGYKTVYLHNQHKNKMTEEERLRLEFYNAGCVRLFELWVLEDCKMSISSLLKISLSLLPDQYTKIQ